jgi:hypothetical protein
MYPSGVIVKSLSDVTQSHTRICSKGQGQEEPSMPGCS